MNDNMESNVDRRIKDEADRLFEEMELMKKYVKNSKFYAGMCKNLKENKTIRTHLTRLLVHHSHVQVVIYCLGSIEFNYNSQFQLAVILLLKQDFSKWIGGIKIYDPVMSPADIIVFKQLGLEVLTENENCKREAKKPTMFYMPSPYYLLGNFLGANWSSSSLNQIFLLTNSLKATMDALPISDQSTLETKIYLIRIEEFTTEIAINTNDHPMYASLFQGFAWHFFKVDNDIGVETPESYWSYMQSYLKQVFLREIESDKTSKEFAQILGSRRGPLQFRYQSVPPQTGWIKLNIYGIGKEGDQTGRFSGVFKDQYGKCLDSYCYKGDTDAKDNVIAGLEALRFGLVRCKEGKPKAEKLMVESENLMLVQYVNGRPEPDEDTQSILNVILHLLKDITCVVYHVYEEANTIARDLVPRNECPGPNAASERKLYAENLPVNLTESQLKEIFEAYGPVDFIQLIKDPRTGHSNGAGFVQFAELEDAKLAQITLNGEIDIIEGFFIKLVPATEHVEVQDDGGGLQHDAKSKGTG